MFFSLVTANNCMNLNEFIKKNKNKEKSLVISHFIIVLERVNDETIFFLFET